MVPQAGARFRPCERLSSGSQFRRVFRRGIRLDGPLFALLAAENDCGYPRLGLAAPRRLGGATARNRAKRLLRESFRRCREGTVGVDLVLIPKREIVDRSQGEVEDEYRDRLRRLLARRAPRARDARPAPRG